METFGLILRNLCLILEMYNIYRFASSNYDFKERVYAGIWAIIMLIIYFNV